MIPIIILIIITIITVLVYRNCFRKSSSPASTKPVIQEIIVKPSIEAGSAEQTPKQEHIESVSVAPQPYASRDCDFKLHIAVDFGTDGIGIAFAYKDKDTKEHKVMIYDKWGAKNRATLKTKAQVVLDDSNEVMYFGNPAKSSFMNMSPKHKKRCALFERFKMALYEQRIGTDNDEIQCDIGDYLRSTNGKDVKADIVFTAVFRYIFEEEIGKFDSINHILKDTNSEDIQWILTVPAIWDDVSKNKMKEWMIKAQLVDPNVKDQCVIVYEPDCASLAIQKQYFKNKDNDEKQQRNGFDCGEKYILIDAGGGTVDIACHEVLDDGSVEELHHPSGGPWGSCYIDDEYIKLLGAIFGTDLIEEYKKQEKTAGYVQLINLFQNAKETFYEYKNRKSHDIEMPQDFIHFLEQMYLTQPNDNVNGDIVKQKINKFRWNLSEYCILFGNDKKYKNGHNKCKLKLVNVNGDTRYREDRQLLRMDINVWKCLFDSKINKIISHVDGYLLKQEQMKHCKYIALVGGFSASKYYREIMNKTFSHKFDIIIPEKPILTVVEGAAYMALDHNYEKYVRARRMLYTYGIRAVYTKKKARECGISEDDIEDNETHDGKVGDIFHCIIRKGERVQLNEIKKNKGYGQSNTAAIPILYSNMKYPKFEEDGEQLGVLEVPRHGEGKNIIQEFHFYGPSFKVFAYPEENPDEKQEIVLKYGGEFKNK